MKKELIIGLTILTIAIAACAGPTAQASPTLAAPTQPALSASTSPANAATQAQTSNTSVSFAKNVRPIFENSCTSCHGVEQMKAGMDMRTYQGLMAGSSNGPVIVPGNAADSFLVQQVVNGKMPKRGSKLTPEQIKTISDWVNAGAQNN